MKNLMSKQEECYGCEAFISNIEIAHFHAEEMKIHPDDVSFPDDIYWKNCRDGPDVWLNCKKRGTFPKPPLKEILKTAKIPFEYDGNKL